MTKLVLQESFPQYEFIVPSHSEVATQIGATIAGHEIRLAKFGSCIQYVPKMSIVGTWHIEPELLSTPSGLDNSLSGKPAATASMATTNVTDDNSNLSFLPDPIRPSKIAIKLQDLYESEYTGSLTAMVENGCPDSKSKEILLQILHEVYDECRKQADAQMNRITQALHPTVGIDGITTSLPSDVVKPLKEYRRKNALQYLPGLIKSFVETLPNKINIANVQLSVCTSFIEKSMKCCWLMCVTEPPMFLKFKWNKSEQIDLDEVEIEGSDGRYVDSMRWPTLYLYENGPLMNKGVVNAK
ncbi:Hypothetical predicted protein [Mytilus galloprovincialis]|uniref:Mitochondria-eating protein C-terminal domain-containing protein n=1 Tax=Mytilus galloprovincialis TaxID=29158 RepID=A0A8B6DMH5_MYTGA|nr:Hypothetical predicted protein [Mytilus galloprovincialis]